MKESGAEVAPLTRASSSHNRISLHILVVDDSAAVRQYMTAKLAQLAGNTFRGLIDEAASGEEAVAYVEIKHYDLVFLDVVMRGMGGHEACRAFGCALPPMARAVFAKREGR